MLPPQFFLEDILDQICVQLLYATISYYFIKQENLFEVYQGFFSHLLYAASTQSALFEKSNTLFSVKPSKQYTV